MRPPAQRAMRRLLTSPWIRRWRIPLAVAMTLLATSVFPQSALLDLTNPGAMPAGALHVPFSYQIIAPLSDLLDILTFLTPAQYWGILWMIAAGFVAYATVTWSSDRSRATRRHVLRNGLRFVVALVGLGELILVARRPMASLVLQDPDLLAVDFHSHTSASHDGRAGFDAEQSRAWHSSAGFDAAYVTDHRTIEGAVSGDRGNPRFAGAGTVLLPGVELRDGDEHPILIGVDPLRTRITSANWQPTVVEPDHGKTPPVLLLSLPGDILRIPFEMTNGLVKVVGIEMSDGSPRGIAQGSRDHDAILELARKTRLATVSASDNHGWGRAAAAWSVMRIPGWREMTPSELDVAIRRTLIDEGPRAVQIVARRTAPVPDTIAGASLSGFAVGLLMLRTMTIADRISWIAWTCAVCALLTLRVPQRKRFGARIWARSPQAGDVDAAA